MDKKKIVQLVLVLIIGFIIKIYVNRDVFKGKEPLTGSLPYFKINQFVSNAGSGSSSFPFPLKIPSTPFKPTLITIL